MKLEEAFNVLDIGKTSSFEDIKSNFKWLVHFHHPDNKRTGNVSELLKILKAFETIKRSLPKASVEQLEKVEKSETNDDKA